MGSGCYELDCICIAFGVDATVTVFLQKGGKEKSKIFLTNVLTLLLYFGIIMVLEFTNEYASREDMYNVITNRIRGQR